MRSSIIWIWSPQYCWLLTTYYVIYYCNDYISVNFVHSSSCYCYKNMSNVLKMNKSWYSIQIYDRLETVDWEYSERRWCTGMAAIRKTTVFRWINLDRGNYFEGTCIYSAALNFQGSDITTSLGKNNQLIWSKHGKIFLCRGCATLIVLLSPPNCGLKHASHVIGNENQAMNWLERFRPRFGQDVTSIKVAHPQHNRKYNKRCQIYRDL